VNEDALKIILLAILALLALVFKYLTPKIKGKFGEATISFRLNRLNPKKYKIINDILIRNKSRSSQIDHVIISNYGIFVIETKNYKGWIFGHESSNYWTQVLYKKKFSLRNPVLQCWGHINTLKTVLSEFSFISYYPIIVFTGTAELKKITSKVPVIKSNKLIRSISRLSIEECLSDEEVDQVYQKLVLLNRKDRASRKMHVRKAKVNQRRSVSSTTCPRCGGKLSPKHGKYGMFYGCSNYPSCNYTKAYKK
jgi:hypothetical protein